MAITNDNSVHIGEDKRQGFIRNIISSEFGREVLNLQPVQRGTKQCSCCKDTLCRFYNTYVYHLKVEKLRPSELQQPSNTTRQHGASPLPDDASELVMRLTSLNTDLNRDIQVQSEAAAMCLFKEALQPLNASLVPTLYGWASNSKGQGWLLTELLPGENLRDKFDALESEPKRSIIKQIAQILKRIQDYTLPSTAKGYGGLGFADDGAIVVGGTPFPGGGPSPTHSDLYAQYLKTQRVRAQQCEVIKGWEGTDIPSRIAKLEDTFSGVREWEKDLRPTLVHGDFDVHNLLFDPQTNRITGIVDFDLAHIGCQGEEYMWSLFSLGHLLLPADKNSEDITVHRQFLLHGLDDAATTLGSRAKSFIDWHVTLVADEEFSKAGVVRPRDVPALEHIQTRYLATQAISPPVFFQVKTLTYEPEVLQKMKQGEQRELENCLEVLGC